MKNTLIILMLLLSFAANAGNNKIDKSKEAKARDWMKNQPLEFIENKGQFMRTDGKAADEVLFKTSFGNCDFYITNKGLSYVFVKYKENEKEEIKEITGSRAKRNFYNPEKLKEKRKKVKYYRLDMNLEGVSINKSNIIKENESKQGHYNYFYAHCPEGIYDVKVYGKITIKSIYKGIDWVIYTNSNSKEHPLKYDFVVHPGADYKDIKIKYSKKSNLLLFEDNSKLRIKTLGGVIEEGKLCSYIDDTNKIVQSKYIQDKESTIMFDIADYDRSKTLVIDPLVWATYYGGSTSYDGFTSLCKDSTDNIYVIGYATTSDFPVLNMNGAFWQSSVVASNDITIVKFNNQGIRQWATFYGGNMIDVGRCAVTDSQNNLYVTGETYSSNLPMQNMSGAYNQQTFGGASDGYILKFNPQGVRLWASYYGGSTNEFFTSLCRDASNRIYITGYTNSTNFPVQQLNNAYWQPNTAGDFESFIVRFNTIGVRDWATYYGGSGYDIGTNVCADHLNNIYFVGSSYSQNFPVQQMAGAYWQPNNGGNANAFIVKFNPLGVRQWATYYGGNPGENATSVCADNQNNIYVAGKTFSSNLPLQNLAGAYNQSVSGGDFDMFILKFNNLGVRKWATYYGGNDNDCNANIICKTDLQDNLYITASSMSTNFPLQQLQNEYWQPNLSGLVDNVILKFNNLGVRQWATYYGSIDNDWGTGIVADSHNDIYFIGEWNEINSYTVDYGNGAYYDNNFDGGDDSFILKISPCNTLKPSSVTTNRNNFCANDTGTITLTAIGGIGDTLRWFTGGCGVNSIGINSPITLASPTHITTYYARWESQCDTSACDSVIVKVNPILIDTLNITLCEGDTFNIANHFYTVSGNYFDTLNSAQGCDSIIYTKLTVKPRKITTVNPSICEGEVYQFGNNFYTVTGLYSDTLTSASGCDSIINCNLTVNQFPHINLGNDTIICEGYSVKLNVATPNATYFWQDGSANPFYIVTKQGLYWVKVAINNCSYSDSIIVNVENCNSIYIPNAIVPSGSNKIFKPIGNITSYSDYYFAIYNRWGQLIFETKDFDIGWDGTYMNKIVQSGVYVYYIKIFFTGTGKTFEKKGIVTLVE